MKTIQEILSWLNISSDDRTEVAYISNNAKCRKKNWLYLAYRGQAHDGNDYVEEALKHGAVSYLSDQVIPDLKEHLEKIAYKFYGIPDLELVGITGTAGKSSTAYLLAQIFNCLKSKTLLITSTNRIPNSFYSERTTPDPFILYPLLQKAKKQGYKRVIMECSSIGIATKRIDYLHFNDMLLTPITSDHLDFHKTRKNYRATKIDYLHSNADNVFMLDSNKSKKFFAKAKSSFFLDSRIADRQCTLENSKFIYLHHRYTAKLILPFNVENLVLVLGYFLERGVSHEVLEPIVRELDGLPGRMERVIDDVFIDYAHTGSAVRRVLKETRKITNQIIVAVIGAGGERDREKRKEYRKALKKYADIVILTDDNPRNEDGAQIIDEVKGRESFIVIPNRQVAIEFALNLRIGDKIVLVMGKGDENYQEIKGEKIHFSDRERILAWRSN